LHVANAARKSSHNRRELLRVKLGLLSEADASAALALSTAEGWNQTEADWTRVIRLEPTGCFAARQGHRLIGTVTTTVYGGETAWIGMMVVQPDFRRQGIGAALMRLALDHVHCLGVARVKLDATPAGQPLYESLGFTAEAELQRWQGVAPSGANPNPPRSNRESHLPLFALDQAAFGADRSNLLEQLIAEGLGEPLVMQSDQGFPEGYALARQGRTATYVGPVVATTVSAVGRLLDGMLARFAAEDVCLDLHRSGLLEPEVLAARGLSKRRSLTRMRFGPRGDAAKAPSICASAGPEFG
jgi:predicted N-acetyltransferase YhbS